MGTIRQAAVFFLRQARTSMRLPAALFLSSFQPLVWMVLFGHLFRAVSTVRGFEGGSYVQFLAPGIAIMTAQFGATYSGLGILGDLQSGLLDKVLVMPIARSAILIGPLLQTTLQTVVQSALILVTAFVMGARARGGVLGILALFAAAALLGSTFAAISNGLALITRRQQTLIAVVNLISMPLTFLSSMMMSHRLMPGWMASIARFNPVDWAVTAARSAFEGEAWLGVLEPLGLLLAFALVVWIVMARSFIIYQRSL